MIVFFQLSELKIQYFFSSQAKSASTLFVLVCPKIISRESRLLELHYHCSYSFFLNFIIINFVFACNSREVHLQNLDHRSWIRNRSRKCIPPSSAHVPSPARQFTDWKSQLQCIIQATIAPADSQRRLRELGVQRHQHEVQNVERNVAANVGAWCRCRPDTFCIHAST